MRHAAALYLALATACSSPEADPGQGAAFDGGTGSDSASGVDAATIAMIEIRVGDRVFDARAAGPADGALVLLLHGFPETSYEWRDVLPVLGRAGYRAVAPDQRGYSPRARPTDDAEYALSELVADVIGMADALGAQRFHVAGHDWGAAVAWSVATLHADRVIDVAPMSVPHPDAFAKLLADPASKQYAASAYFELFSRPGFESTMLANGASFYRGMFPGFDAAVIDEYLGVLGDPAALAAALGWYRANVAGRKLSAPPLGATTVPTLYLWSDQDTALVREGVDLTPSYVTGPYRLEVLPGVDHWLVDREPARVAELLATHFGG